MASSWEQSAPPSEDLLIPFIGDHKVDVYFASGNGGNKIYVVPSFHMVIAITSSAYSTHYGQHRSQDILWKILAATREE